MQIVCPTCHNTIEVARLSTVEEVLCPSCGSTFRLAEGGSTTGWRPGEAKRLGRFELLEPVGRGAFGTVYKARDSELDRVVALKVPRAGQLAAPQELDRFLREARSAARLRHPGIVPVHEVGEAEGVPYLVCDFVRGVTLTDLLTAGRPVPEEAARITAAVADSLQYAHEQGVIHRDVKPSNIMLERAGIRNQESGIRNRESGLAPTAGAGATPLIPDSRFLIPRLMDFGLAKRDAGEATMTTEGQVLGTPAYMSPEQARGEGHTVDGRSDVYSLGVVLYQLLTGEPPFRGTARMLLHQVLTDEPKPPRALNDRVPRDLQTICLKAMAKEPRRRYPSAGELAADLRRFLGGEPIRARPVGRAERLWRWSRRNPVVAALAATAGLLLVTAAAASTAAYLINARALVQEADQRREAVRQRDAARHQLYLSQMVLGQQAWESANIDWLRELLDRQQPQEDRPDVRRWEWHYLRSLLDRDLHTFQGHRGHVQAVAWSPDGKRLASAGRDQTVRVWDLAAGRQLHRLDGHTRGLETVAWSPDGKRLASAGEDQAIKVWDADTGAEVLSLKKHGRTVMHVAWSPDGGRLASAGTDNRVVVWSAATGKDEQTLRVEAAVHAVAWLDGGKQVAGVTGDKGVYVWDAATGKEVLSLPLAKTSVTSAAWSPDGRRIATSDGSGDVAVWDAATGEHVVKFPRQAHTPRAESVAWSPDGRWLASSGLDGPVMIWDPATGESVQALRGHLHKGIFAVAWSPDGRRLASGGGDGAVKVWDPRLPPEYLALSTEAITHEVVCWRPDGKRFASGGWWLSREPVTVWDWDAATGQALRRPGKSPTDVTALAWSPDGRLLATATDIMVHVRDAEDLTETVALGGHTKQVNSLAWSPDGSRLASCSHDKSIIVWDAAGGKALHTLQGHGETVLSVAWSRDGKHLASTGHDHTVRIWDPHGGQLVQTLPGHPGGTVLWVAWSPDNRHVASAGADSTVKVWDALDGEEVLTLRGHTSLVTSVAWSPDGDRLATSCFDMTVRVWDAVTGQPVLILRPSKKLQARSVAWSPDGRQLAAATGEAVVIWDTQEQTEPRRRQREAFGLFHFAREELMLKEEMMERIRRDAAASELVRERALAQAEQYRPNPRHLDEAARPAVREAGKDAAAYALALRRAEVASRLDSQRGEYLTTLGMAQYRAGKHQAAVETLAKAREANKETPTDLAFLAMAQHRLGQKDQARATLTRLLEVTKRDRRGRDKETQAFLREAQALLEAKD